MIDENKLIEELKEYEDALYDLGELAMMGGVSGAILIVESQPKIETKKERYQMKNYKKKVLNLRNLSLRYMEQNGG